jgi:RNA-splicing ligase RtcB
MSPYRELEHTADWALQVWSPTLEGLFTEAAKGMYTLSGARPYGQSRNTHDRGRDGSRVCASQGGNAGLPPEYQPLGQPVLVPGSMGTASWVLLGTEGSMAQSFGSSCHGAGRVMSRARAKREIRGEALRRELEANGIRIRAGSPPGLAEEAPAAYKDVDRVIDVVSRAGIAKKVARLRPVAVIKG